MKHLSVIFLCAVCFAQEQPKETTVPKFTPPIPEAAQMKLLKAQHELDSWAVQESNTVGGIAFYAAQCPPYKKIVDLNSSYATIQKAKDEAQKKLDAEEDQVYKDLGVKKEEFDIDKSMTAFTPKKKPEATKTP